MVQKTVKEILDLKIQQTGNKRKVTYIPELTTEEYRVCLQELVSLDITVFVYEEKGEETEYYCITDKKQVYNITRLVFLLHKTRMYYDSRIQYNIQRNTISNADYTLLPDIQVIYKKFTKGNTNIQDSIRKALGEVIL